MNGGPSATSVCAPYTPRVIFDPAAGGKTDTSPLYFVTVGKSFEQAPGPFPRCQAYQQWRRLRVRNGHAAPLVWIAALARSQPTPLEARNPRWLSEQGKTDLRLAQTTAACATDPQRAKPDAHYVVACSSRSSTGAANQRCCAQRAEDQCADSGHLSTCRACGDLRAASERRSPGIHEF